MKKGATERQSSSIKEPLILIIGTLIICVGLIASFIVFKNYYSSLKKELPTIAIDLKDITLEDFRLGDKKAKYSGNTFKISSDGQSREYEDIEVRGRGNSTWGLPKPPFQIKFNESIDLFGLGEAKKWVLLANYYDHSNLRNDLAFKLADMLEEKYAMRGEFVKVTVDGDYIGVYYLTHKMEAKKGSVDLQSKYGVLMEVDELHRSTEDCIDTSNKICMTVKDTVADEDEESEIRDRAIEAFMEDYNAYEAAVRAKDFEAVSEIVDIESLAQYFLINEFAVNPDAYNSSLYFYKDGLDDKIHAGPIWDYDYAFANPEWDYWNTNGYSISPYSTTLFKLDQSAVVAKEVYQLLEMPEFMTEVKKVFAEKLSGRSEELISWLKQRAASIKEEALADAARGGIGNTEEDTENLIDWVRRRFDYFEYTYGRK